MTFELADMARKDRRERIAMRCLQGLLANSNETLVEMELSELVENAVTTADALIAELDKPVDKPRAESSALTSRSGPRMTDKYRKYRRMVVICTDTTDVEQQLSIGSKYEVQAVTRYGDHTYYQVRNDAGDLAQYGTHRFDTQVESEA